MKIELSREPEDSMVIATPFEKKKAFYYNQKIVEREPGSSGV